MSHVYGAPFIYIGSGIFWSGMCDMTRVQVEQAPVAGGCGKTAMNWASSHDPSYQWDSQTTVGVHV